MSVGAGQKVRSWSGLEKSIKVNTDGPSGAWGGKLQGPGRDVVMTWMRRNPRCVFSGLRTTVTPVSVSASST
ncbi:hypothetical protein GUG51_20350, partial [Xanthomonas citri pv. citri]|nr:hypothetical protein [Xanthomonas citri pv. citri]